MAAGLRSLLAWWLGGRAGASASASEGTSSLCICSIRTYPALVAESLSVAPALDADASVYPALVLCGTPWQPPVGAIGWADGFTLAEWASGFTLTEWSGLFVLSEETLSSVGTCFGLRVYAALDADASVYPALVADSLTMGCAR